MRLYEPSPNYNGSSHVATMRRTVAAVGANAYSGCRNRNLEGIVFNEDTMYLLNFVNKACEQWPGASFSLDRRGSFWFADIYTGIYQKNHIHNKMIKSGPCESPEEALLKLIAEAVKERLS